MPVLVSVYARINPVADKIAIAVDADTRLDVQGDSWNGSRNEEIGREVE
jgi:hypothetical protein